MQKVIILALPIMLGSAGQNIIALTDSLFYIDMMRMILQLLVLLVCFIW